MDEVDPRVRLDEIRKEIGVLVQEWSHLTDHTDGTTGILTGCVISFESTRFDTDGTQVYRTDHLTIDPTSNAQAIGLMQDCLWSMHHNSFGHCHG